MGKQRNTKIDKQKTLFTDGGSPFSFIQAAGEMLSEAEAQTMRERIPLNPLATPEMIMCLRKIFMMILSSANMKINCTKSRTASKTIRLHSGRRKRYAVSLNITQWRKRWN